MFAFRRSGLTDRSVIKASDLIRNYAACFISTLPSFRRYSVLIYLSDGRQLHRPIVQSFCRLCPFCKESIKLVVVVCVSYGFFIVPFKAFRQSKGDSFLLVFFKCDIKPAIGIITDSEMLRTMAKTPGEKFAGVMPTEVAISPTWLLTDSNIPDRFPMMPETSISFSQSVICWSMLSKGDYLLVL